MQQSYKVTDKKGSVHYYKDKEHTIHHRLDGPAVEYSNGSKAWYVNGRRHRLDGPAVEHTNGSIWYVNGKHHRLDGPAVDYDNGFRVWCVNDRFLCAVDSQGRIVDRMYKL